VLGQNGAGVRSFGHKKRRKGPLSHSGLAPTVPPRLSIFFFFWTFSFRHQNISVGLRSPPLILLKFCSIPKKVPPNSCNFFKKSFQYQVGQPGINVHFRVFGGAFSLDPWAILTSFPLCSFSPAPAPLVRCPILFFFFTFLSGRCSRMHRRNEACLYVLSVGGQKIVFFFFFVSPSLYRTWPLVSHPSGRILSHILSPLFLDVAWGQVDSPTGEILPILPPPPDPRVESQDIEHEVLFALLRQRPRLHTRVQPPTFIPPFSPSYKVFVFALNSPRWVPNFTVFFAEAFFSLSLLENPRSSLGDTKPPG